MSSEFVVSDSVQAMTDQADLAAFSRIAATDAFDTFYPLEPYEIGARQLVERFSAVAHIKTAILETYKRHDGRIAIPYGATTNENELILKIMGTIDFSQEYKNVTLRVTRRAIRDLFKNTEEAKQLLSWEKQPRKQQERLLQNLHGRMMNEFKWKLGGAIGPITSDNFAPLQLVEEAKEYHGRFYSLTMGRAHTVDGKRHIDVNAHDDAAFQNLREPVNTTAHETAHIFEDVLRSAFQGPLPVDMPDWLRRDMQICFMQKKTNAYIPPIIGTPYHQQFNEALAWKVGEAAENQLRECINFEKAKAYSVGHRPAR